MSKSKNLNLDNVGKSISAIHAQAEDLRRSIQDIDAINTHSLESLYVCGEGEDVEALLGNLDVCIQLALGNLYDARGVVEKLLKSAPTVNLKMWYVFGYTRSSYPQPQLLSNVDKSKAAAEQKMRIYRKDSTWQGVRAVGPCASYDIALSEFCSYARCSQCIR